MAGAEADCTVFVANLDPRVSEEILWELFLQAGPMKSIHIPWDKETGKQKTYGFIEFSSSASALYARELLDGIRLYDRPLTVKPKAPENGEPARRMVSNVMSAGEFYERFYNVYEELKRRPQSEPRRSYWNEEASHHRSGSFNVPSRSLCRSASVPAYLANNTSPQLQQLWNMMQPGHWNSSTPHRDSPSLRVPYRSYAESPPYGSYFNPCSSDPPYRGSQHGYQTPRQSPHRR